MIKLISDIHFGLRRNSSLFHSILIESLHWFLKDVRKSDSIIILGDIFDSRSSIDFKILNDACGFFDTLSKSCKEIFILVGNHDLYYKELDLKNVNFRFLNINNDSIKIIHEITEIKIENKECLFIPWIDSIDKKECAKQFLFKEYDLVLGHFDSVGIYNGKEIDTSLMFKPEDFQNNKTILSGHFHKRKNNGTITYIGSVINQSFNDVGEIKGYYTFDKENTLTFIKGICPRFEYIHIKDSYGFIKGYEQANEKDKENLRNHVNGNIIKIFMDEYNSENEELYKIFKGMTPLEISISYNKIELKDGVEEEGDFAGFDSKSDIMEIISEYVYKVKESIPDDINPDDITKLISERYNKFKSIV